MTTPSCPQVEESLGALLLGALEPGERELVEQHVRDCPSCAQQVADLASVPPLLHRVGLSPRVEVEPAPPHVLETAVARARAADRRRRRTFVITAAAAAVVLVAVGGAVVRTHRTTPTTVVASARSDALSAQVVMTPSESGTTLALTLSGVTPGEHCELVAVSQTGATEVASSWVANYEGEATVMGSTALGLADIVRLTVSTPQGRTLLSLPVPS